MEKQRNQTGREHCGACDDTGWVELAGTVTVGQTTYTRGMAPCKWCELGVARFMRHPDLESDFDADEIVVPDPQGPPFVPDTAFLREREAAGIPIGALKAMFPRKLWPAEWAHDATEPTMLGDLNEPNRPYHHENDPIAADQAPQEPFSAAPGDDPDLDHAENLDEEPVPW